MRHVSAKKKQRRHKAVRLSGRVARIPRIVQVEFSLRKRKGQAPAPARERVRVAVLTPARAFPLAVAIGFASLFFTHTDTLATAPVAYPPLSATPGLAFSHLSAASLVRTFALPSASGLGFGHTRTPSQNTFRALFQPGNTLARARSSPGASPRLSPSIFLLTHASCLFCLH